MLAALVVGAARRRLARVLGGVRRHPGVHRDPGGHAAVPWPGAAGAEQHLARRRSASRTRRSPHGLPERVVRRATGTTSFTLVVFARRGGRLRVRASGVPRQRASPTSRRAAACRCSSLKIVVVGAVVMWFAWQLANDRGLPNVLIILAVLIIVYTLVTQRTVFGRHVYAIGGNLDGCCAVRRQGPKWINFWHHSSTWACWPASPAWSSRPGSNASPAGRGQHVRARRDRRVLHRWCGGHRRRRHRDRCDGRWSDHGRDEQRHAADGHRDRRPSRWSRAWCCCSPSRSTCTTSAGRAPSADLRHPRRRPGPLRWGPGRSAVPVPHWRAGRGVRVGRRTVSSSSACPETMSRSSAEHAGLRGGVDERPRPGGLTPMHGHAVPLADLRLRRGEPLGLARRAHLDDREAVLDLDVVQQLAGDQVRDPVAGVGLGEDHVVRADAAAGSARARR